MGRLTTSKKTRGSTAAGNNLCTNAIGLFVFIYFPDFEQLEVASPLRGFKKPIQILVYKYEVNTSQGYMLQGAGYKFLHYTSSSTRSQPSSSASLDTSSILSRATPSPAPYWCRFMRGREAGFAVVAWRSWAKSRGKEGGVGSGIFGYVS